MDLKEFINKYKYDLDSGDFESVKRAADSELDNNQVFALETVLLELGHDLSGRISESGSELVLAIPLGDLPYEIDKDYLRTTGDIVNFNKCIEALQDPLGAVSDWYFDFNPSYIEDWTYNKEVWDELHRLGINDDTELQKRLTDDGSSDDLYRAFACAYIEGQTYGSAGDFSTQAETALYKSLPTKLKSNVDINQDKLLISGSKQAFETTYKELFDSYGDDYATGFYEVLMRSIPDEYDFYYEDDGSVFDLEVFYERLIDELKQI